MEQPPSRDSERRDPLSFDEFVALIVAFTAVGAVLWWGIGRRSTDWLNQRFLSDRPDGESTSLFDFSRSEPSVAARSGGEEPAIETNPVPGPSAAANLPEVSPSPATRINPVVVAPVVIAPAVLPPRPSPSPEIESPTAVSPTAPTTPTVPTVPTVVVPSVDPAKAVAFTDVPNDYWAYPFIAALTQRGIISGFADNSFQPDQPVNRAQYAALVSQVLPSAQQTPISFGDVPPEFWGTAAIDESVQSGFVRGYPDQTFQPDRPISRQEVLLSLVNGFGLPKSTNPDPALSVFQDQQQIPAWAKPAIGTAAESGLIVSYPDTQQFNPNQPATRAEVAAMLYQALTASGKLPPLQSNYIVRP